MMDLAKEVLDFFKKPVIAKDQNTNWNYRLNVFFKLLLLGLATGFVISPMLSLLEALEIINLENHAAEQMMKDFSKTQIFLFGVVLAPFFEELIFRGPLTAFKNPKHFGIAFYVFTILFGLVHITNFEITRNIILLSPLLVLPQIILGGYLGFIRIRFGLPWSIALHATYNAILIGLSLLFDTP